MNYTRKIDTDKAVEVQISSFTGKGGTTEYQVMVSITDPCLSFVEQLQNLLRVYVTVVKEELSNDATAVFRRYFLSDAANQTDNVMEWECESAFCPLSIVQQPPLNGTKIAMWTYLQTGMSVQTHDSGLLEASHNGYRHLWGGGAFNKAANSEYQTRLLLNDYVMQLMEQGCKLADNCIRTWFFVQNVDVNYAGIVKARRENFLGQGLTESTHYIASTGIEGRHADPKIHVLFDAYAVKGLQPGQVTYLHALSHLSPTALYGVTFERGTSVEYGDRRHLFISGTASIDHRGEVVHVGDVREQTRRMWENVEKLLEEGKAGFEDVAQMIVYLRDASDYPVVRALFAKRFPDTPIQFVVAAVCRPAWLIEMECIAIVANSNSSYESF